MALLTYRTNLLLSEEEHQTVAQVAKQKGQSISQVVRHAIQKTYAKSKKDNGLSQRMQVLKRLRELGAQVNTKGINYKELVEEGRKYWCNGT